MERLHSSDTRVWLEYLRDGAAPNIRLRCRTRSLPKKNRTEPLASTDAPSRDHRSSLAQVQEFGLREEEKRLQLKLGLMEGEVKGGTVWSASQSTFMQTFLANLVADGTKTSTGFKKVHLNACAKALNDHFKISRTGDQIGNHLKTLKKKYIRINQLRNKSGAGWDEDQFIIYYDHEMYTSHFKDEEGKDRNKGDDEYINKPLPYYGNLAVIFGNSVATGQFVRTSNEPLGVDAQDEAQREEMNVGTPSSATVEKDDTAASGSRPSKRAKRDENGDNFLVQALYSSADTLASAIKEAAATRGKLVPPGLWKAVDDIDGFEHSDKIKYYTYMLGQPNIAYGFMDAPLIAKISMLSDFLNGNM